MGSPWTLAAYSVEGKPPSDELSHRTHLSNSPPPPPPVSPLVFTRPPPPPLPPPRPQSQVRPQSRPQSRLSQTCSSLPPSTITTVTVVTTTTVPVTPHRPPETAWNRRFFPDRQPTSSKTIHTVINNIEQGSTQRNHSDSTTTSCVAVLVHSRRQLQHRHNPASATAPN